jgi:hypothetical protein
MVDLSNKVSDNDHSFTIRSDQLLISRFHSGAGLKSEDMKTKNPNGVSSKTVGPCSKGAVVIQEANSKQLSF